MELLTNSLVYFKKWVVQVPKLQNTSIRILVWCTGWGNRISIKILLFPRLWNPVNWLIWWNLELWFWLRKIRLFNLKMLLFYRHVIDGWLLTFWIKFDFFFFVNFRKLKIQRYRKMTKIYEHNENILQAFRILSCIRISLFIFSCVFHVCIVLTNFWER